MSVSMLSETSELRPSQVVAEALVDRQGPSQVEARARELGFCTSLTTAVVHACCGAKESGEMCERDLETVHSAD